MRAADALQTVDPDAALIQCSVQLFRRQNFPGDALRQPKIDAEETGDADEQDRGAEHRADTGDGNRDQENYGEESGENQKTVLTDNVADLGQSHPAGR